METKERRTKNYILFSIPGIDDINFSENDNFKRNLKVSILNFGL